MSHVLIAVAFGFSVSDMQREFGVSRGKAQSEMEAALGAFEAMIHARTKAKAWGSIPLMKSELEAVREKIAKLIKS